jgi:hypothetical protein
LSLLTDEQFRSSRSLVEEEAVHSRYEIKKRQEERKDVVGVACGFNSECAPWVIVWLAE